MEIIAAIDQHQSFAIVDVSQQLLRIG